MSDIVVKDPDKLLKDINEVSKGIIMTSDGKYIIAQRSDSSEWDAPGGHLMQGEEANFAFYREVLEELSLKVKKVQYLGSMDTTWKKKNRLVHYFLAQTNYSSEELEGVIQLQWEIADYFCDDLEGIIEKMGEGATHNLENTMNLLGQGNLIIERAWPHSDNHSTKKRRLVGGGLNTHTESGIKKVTDHSRAEGATSTFGVFEGTEDKKNKKIKISIRRK